MTGGKYTEGDYLKDNPSWHVEDSPWKAEQIFRIIDRNGLQPKEICEIGCGAGEILIQLQKSLDERCNFIGYDISPQAIEIARQRTNERLIFKQSDFLKEVDVYFDIILAIDLLEHLENYFQFLRAIKDKAEYKIFHIPLNLSVQAVLRAKPLVVSWQRLGHIHNFNKETAFQMMADTGYQVVDFFYTSSYTELPPKSRNAAIARLPRKIAFSISQEMTVRLMGGYSLMVLAR